MKLSLSRPKMVNELKMVNEQAIASFTIKHAMIACQTRNAEIFVVHSKRLSVVVICTLKPIVIHEEHL